MWNFAGRQNDLQGRGDLMNGNWITGIKFIDAMRLGPQDNLPDSVVQNKGRNKYYAIPLILGLIGAFFYYRKEKKGFWIVTMLFLMTGAAIIVYLNEVPRTPRERDYVYVGSFYAFAIFIGMGVLYLYELLQKWLSSPIGATLASGFTILFLFWSITHLARKVFARDEKLSTGNLIAVIGAGVVGALSYTFTDSFWFSAVEAEVYALSSLFTAGVFWAILKWEEVRNPTDANRWLLLIAFLMGLSVGVHILNLLAIPAIVLVYYFKNYTYSNKGLIAALLASFGILAVLLYGVIQFTLKLALGFELFFINTVGLPYNAGVMIFIVALIAALVFGLYYTTRKKKAVWNTIILGVTMVMIGYSSILVIPIRSAANPPLDENNPENIGSLLSYVNREVYGQRPLFMGEYYNAPIEEYKEGKSIYYQKDGKYVVGDKRTKYVYDKRFTTFFPRMYNNMDPGYVPAYQEWGKVKGTPIQITNRNTGEQEIRNRPTFTENMRFFFSYQLGHMYFRYFMWNFAGRQNDLQGRGDLMNGNWITGIKFIDAMRLGPQDNLPDSVVQNKGRNKYYAIPLILGLIGAFFYYRKEKKGFWIVTMLFLMTGAAIIVYLNEVPRTPRERDYVYVGSFYAFAIFIGMGVLYLYELLQKWLSSPIGATLATVVPLIVVPGILATQNWDDHDRSGRYAAHDFAYNYLVGLDENSVVFTNGDNDTFPLWYIQEVEDHRTDVRVGCMPFMPQDWYITQMKSTYYESKALPISMEFETYRQGERGLIPIIPQQSITGPQNLKSIVNFAASDNPSTIVGSSGGSQFNFIPTDHFILPVDSATVVNNGTVSPEMAGQIESPIVWKMGKEQIYKDELVILDLLANNNWERPIYFTTPGQNGSVRLDEYLELTGLTYRLVPIKGERQTSGMGRVNTKVAYDNLMNKFRYTNFGNEDIYFDETCRRMMTNLKNNFNRLAFALIEENQIEKTKEVLTKLEETLPPSILGYTYLDVSSAEAWYRIGEREKGKVGLEASFNHVVEQMEYFYSMPDKYLATLGVTIQNNLYELREQVRIAKEFEEELSKVIEEKFNTYASKYYGGLGQGQ